MKNITLFIFLFCHNKDRKPKRERKNRAFVYIAQKTTKKFVEYFRC